MWTKIVVYLGGHLGGEGPKFLISALRAERVGAMWSEVDRVRSTRSLLLQARVCNDSPHRGLFRGSFTEPPEKRATPAKK